MYSTMLVSVFASVPQTVPDVGPSGLLLGLGLLSLGLVARLIKNRRK
jgi:MYXO-CTERM domain-containing protein